MTHHPSPTPTGTTQHHPSRCLYFINLNNSKLRAIPRTLAGTHHGGSPSNLPPFKPFQIPAQKFHFSPANRGDAKTAGSPPTITYHLSPRRYVFAKNTKDDADWLPSTKTAHYVGMATLMAGTSAVALTMDTATAVNIVGIGGDVIVVAMFGGPLVAIKTVIEEKSTRSLPFAFTVAAFVNCSLWSTYGFAVLHDPYIWLPNVLGLTSACAQLALFAKYGIGSKGK